ncbi:MAG: fructosamine kinase family protein [Opitutales bacterium]
MNPGEANRPDPDVVPTTAAAASAIATAALGRSVEVLERRPLSGGKINAVEAWRLDGSPGDVVVKIDLRGQGGALTREAGYLRYLRAHTHLPVPEPLGLSASTQPDAKGEALFLERLAGRHLGHCRLSDAGQQRVQETLADALADLHRHTRPTYGPCMEPDGPTSWAAAFRTRLVTMLDAAAPRLKPELLHAIATLAEELEDLLATDSAPTLIHGDVWAANILVDDSDPDQPSLSGLVDPRGEFCDTEFELAYLNGFGPEFAPLIARYREHHPERPGFADRCRLYWLYFMLVHVWIFGDSKYLRRTAELVAQIHSKTRAKHAQ